MGRSEPGISLMRSASGDSLEEFMELIQISHTGNSDKSLEFDVVAELGDRTAVAPGSRARATIPL
jgi:hypothetical protein